MNMNNQAKQKYPALKLKVNLNAETVCGKCVCVSLFCKYKSPAANWAQFHERRSVKKEEEEQ